MKRFITKIRSERKLTDHPFWSDTCKGSNLTLYFNDPPNGPDLNKIVAFVEGTKPQGGEASADECIDLNKIVATVDTFVSPRTRETTYNLVLYRWTETSGTSVFCEARCSKADALEKLLYWMKFYEKTVTESYESHELVDLSKFVNADGDDSCDSCDGIVPPSPCAPILPTPPDPQSQLSQPESQSRLPSRSSVKQSSGSLRNGSSGSLRTSGSLSALPSTQRKNRSLSGSHGSLNNSSDSSLPTVSTTNVSSDPKSPSPGRFKLALSGLLRKSRNSDSPVSPSPRSPSSLASPSNSSRSNSARSDSARSDSARSDSARLDSGRSSQEPSPRPPTTPSPRSPSTTSSAKYAKFGGGFFSTDGFPLEHPDTGPTVRRGNPVDLTSIPSPRPESPTLEKKIHTTQNLPTVSPTTTSPVTSRRQQHQRTSSSSRSGHLRFKVLEELTRKTNNKE